MGTLRRGDVDFFTVDYYEKGNQMYQYSKDILDQIKEMEGLETAITLDIKSVYENGKIIEGVEYQNIENGFLTKRIKDQKLHSFSVDIFAGHSYNRISFDIEKDIIKINELQHKNYKDYLFFEKIFMGWRTLGSGQCIDENCNS